MKTLSFEKFKGLQVQANSFQDQNGTFEIANNVVISRDDIVSRRRGFRSEYYMPENMAKLVDYQGANFAIGNHIYRLDTAATGTCYSFANSDSFVIRSNDHDLDDGDWLSDVLSTSEAFVASWPYRYADFVGQVQIITEFNDLNAAATGTSVTVTQADHGMQNGDQIRVYASDIGATGTFPVTGVTSSTYTYVDATATGTGQVSVQYLDAMRLTAANQALTSASGTMSWNDYDMLDGDLFTVADYVPTLKTGKSLYWGANEGLHKIETTSGPVMKAGVPPALDTDCILSGTSGGVAANSQSAYRVVFGRRDDNNVTHLSSPSDVVLVANTTRASTTLSLATGTNVLTVTDSGNGLSNGDIIYLYDVVSNDSPADGSSVSVTGVTGTTFQFDFDDLGVAPSGVTSLEYGVRKTGTVYASIPSEITSTDYFYQVYRSDSTDATVIPDARYKLVEQISLTSTDIARGFIVYVDELPFEIIQSNAELYTNPTQEGEAQANNRPPLFTDMDLFKGFTFFADCTAYRQLALSLVSTTDLANATTVTIAGTTYIFRGDANNAPVGNDITTSSATVSAGAVVVTQSAHGFSANDVIYHIGGSGITLAAGLYAVTVVNPNSFSYGTGATGTSGTVTYEGREDSTGRLLVTLTEPSSTAAETIAEAIDFTARSLVKACNRDASNLLYAQYVSGVDESPGRILFTAKTLDAATFAATASTTAVGACFSPALPTTGTSVDDFQDEAPNALFCSKYLEAEAVPIVNRFPVGSQDSAILRVLALRDSLIIMKEDGVFRLNGDSISNFSVTALDTTVILKAVRSVVVLNNSVYALTNQGVVQVTDTSVKIISRAIEPLLTGVLGQSTLDYYTSGIAYESERLYILTTLEPNTGAVVAYCYNYLTDAWTSWDGTALAYSGYVSGITDKIAHVYAADRKDIIGERKTQTKIDYSGQDLAAQIEIKRIASMTSTAGDPQVCIQVPEDHGIIVGDVITVSGCDTTLAAAFSSGAASVNGLRTVTSVTDKIVCFDADENGLTSTLGSAYWQRGISELSCQTDTTNGSRNVVITTTVDHGLSTGDAVVIDSLAAALSAAFTADSKLTGYRPVTVLTGTTFQVKADATAGATVTSTAQLTDKRGINDVCSMWFPTQPQVGDALVSNGKFYKLTGAEKYDTGRFIIETNVPVAFRSTDLVYHHQSYALRVKFAPITMGTGVLKQFAEFQAWFRNANSCSQLAVGFSTDSRYSDKVVHWSNFVGTPEGLVTFGGWGAQSWGNFPWGGGTNIDLELASGPAVPLRTWVPQNSYLATFIQPELLHKVAGETFELQSVSLIGQPATQKVSK
jgi:hypothetical protein